ncbi:MAG: hypothetical protein ACM369_15205 [Acidobacteriota bacterium]
MKKGLIPGLSFLAALALAAAPAVRADDDDPNEKGSPVAHVHPVRGSRPGGASSSPNMTYHNGTIMPSSTTKSIFWGTSWSSSDPKIAGLQSFYTGFNQSNYAVTSDEYSGSNGQVGPTISVLQYVLDTSSGLTRAPKTSTILAEVCKEFTGPADGTAYYAVYTDLPRGHAGYCAWHSWGSCNGAPVQFAFFFDLDGDPGCDPGDDTTGHSQGLAALANVSAHELSEARTDPRGAGWFDSSGAENGDKCAWTFNVPSVSFPNGTSWKLQGEWSNAAYTAGTGYPNNSGQKGCLDGH